LTIARSHADSGEGTASAMEKNSQGNNLKTREVMFKKKAARKGKSIRTERKFENRPETGAPRRGDSGKRGHQEKKGRLA